MRDPGDVVEFSWQVRPAGAGGPTGPDGERVVADGDGGPRLGGQAGRRYLRLWFSCSGEYGRAYVNAAGDGYHGRCPRCGREVRFRIGPGGSSERFFEVRCG